MPKAWPAPARRWLVGFATAGLALVGAVAPAGAATTFTVNNTADLPDQNAADQVCQAMDGSCTVRAAIQQANSVLGADEIRIPAGTYPVTAGLLQLDTAMTIVGISGARSTTFDMQGTNSALVMNNSGPIAIRGIAVTGSNGIYSPLYINGPDVSVTGAWIHDNTSTGGHGGGIYLFSGSLTVVRSSVTGNKSTGPNSTGGGITIATGDAIVESTTVASNTTQGGSTGYGGGIYTNGTSLALRHVTLTDNVATAGSAAQHGGNLSLNGDTSIADSIITGGQSANAADCGGDGTGAITVSGKNIYAGAAGNCAFPAANVVAPPANLAPLGDHGGLNGFSRPPLVVSPAIDAAAVCPVDAIDQRGGPAPAGAACDIGAAELGADLQLTLSSSAGSTGPGDQVTYIAKVTNGGVDNAPNAVVALTPPNGSTVVLVSPSQGTCAAPATCNLGTLARDDSASVTVVVSAPQSGTMQASATATSDVPDPTPANASATGEVINVVPGGDTTPPGDTPPVDTPPDGTPPTTDTTRPVLSNFAPKGKLRAGRRQRLKLTLSEDATVTIAVRRLLPGRKVNGKCRVNRTRGRRCTVAKRFGSFTRQLRKGANTFAIPKFRRGKRLPVGRYRLIATAKDAAGNKAKPVRLKVRVR